MTHHEDAIDPRKAARARDPLSALEQIALASVAITALALTDRAVEVTFPQWRVLVVVGEQRTGMTMTEIAARIRSGLSPASKLVARLERRGLLATAKDRDDRRVTRVTVTPAGAEMRAAVFARRTEYLSAVARELGPVDAATMTVLDRLATILNRYA